jgi:hypothetical protein
MLEVDVGGEQLVARTVSGHPWGQLQYWPGTPLSLGVTLDGKQTKQEAMVDGRARAS